MALAPNIDLSLLTALSIAKPEGVLTVESVMETYKVTHEDLGDYVQPLLEVKKGEKQVVFPPGTVRQWVGGTYVKQHPGVTPTWGYVKGAPAAKSKATEKVILPGEALPPELQGFKDQLVPGHSANVMPITKVHGKFVHPSKAGHPEYAAHLHPQPGVPPAPAEGAPISPATDDDEVAATAAPPPPVHKVEPVKVEAPPEEPPKKKEPEPTPAVVSTEIGTPDVTPEALKVGKALGYGEGSLSMDCLAAIMQYGHGTKALDSVILGNPLEDPTKIAKIVDLVTLALEKHLAEPAGVATAPEAPAAKEVEPPKTLSMTYPAGVGMLSVAAISKLGKLGISPGNYEHSSLFTVATMLASGASAQDSLAFAQKKHPGYS